MQEIGPRSLPSYLMINGDHIQRKPLSSCAKCPMSICLDCERDIGAGVPVVTLAERCGAAEAVSSGCGAMPIETTKLADSYEMACELFAIFPSEQDGTYAHAAYSSFDTPARRDEVLSSLASRVRLPAVMNGTAGAAAADTAGHAGFSAGGRSSRRREVICYSDNTPKKMPGVKTNSNLLPICLNCTSTDCHLLLAKSLERMTANMCNSRLSLPFLRPLLPFDAETEAAATTGAATAEDNDEDNDADKYTGGDSSAEGDHDSDEDCVQSGDGGSSLTAAVVHPRDPKYIFQEMRAFLRPNVFREFQLPRPILRQALCGAQSPYAPREEDGSGSGRRMLDALLGESPDPPPGDMLAVFEKVRRLEYRSAGQLLCDMQDMRRLVASRVERAEAGMGSNRNSSVLADGKRILWAFDCVVEAAVRFDNANQVLHKKLETSIEHSINPPATTNRSRRSGCVGEVGNGDGVSTARTGSKRSRCELDSSSLTKRMKLDDSGDSYSFGTFDASIDNDEGGIGGSRGAGVGAGAGAELPTAALLPAGVRAAQRELLLVWRAECEAPIKAAHTSRNYVVSARADLPAWSAYLQRGHMPPDSRKRPEGAAAADGDSDGDAGDGAASHEEGDTSSVFPMFGNGKLSWLRAMGIEEMASEVEAAQIMTGFRYNNLRENVSLQHSADADSGPLAAEMDPMMGRREGGECSDDNMVILEELRETTRRSLLLGAQLQERLRKQERETLACASTNITLGEGKLISELKLANDNLRWRLQQKCRTVAAFEELSSDLKGNIAGLNETIREKDEALAKYRNEVMIWIILIILNVMLF
jgi:hypothetical protein